jgi:hypothetical protein
MTKLNVPLKYLMRFDIKHCEVGDSFIYSDKVLEVVIKGHNLIIARESSLNGYGQRDLLIFNTKRESYILPVLPKNCAWNAIPLTD